MDDSNKIYDSESVKKASPTSLKEAENSSSSEFVVDNEFDKLGKGYVAGGKASRFGFIGKLKSASKKKWLIGGLLGSGLGVVVVLVILLMIASSLKIPNLAQHIASYELARTTRQYSENATRVTDEKLALAATEDGTNNSLYSQLRNKYSTSTGKISETWSKLDKYRPEKVIDNLSKSGGLKLNYKGNQFLSASLDGVDYVVKPQGATRFIPVLKDVIKFKNNVQFSQDFVPALKTSLKANDIGPIIRGATAKSIRQELGIGLVAWNLGKFQGKTADQARLEEERQKITSIDKGAKPVTSSVDEINKASKEIETITQNTVSDPAELEKVIENGGASAKIQSVLASVGDTSVFKTALGVVSPFISVAMPLCIIYDGSLVNSGPTINNSSQQQQSAFYYIESAADQQKQGSSNSADSSSLTVAIGATNADLGDITSSYPEVRAAGGTIDTSKSLNAQTSATGDYTLLDVVLGNKAGLINAMAIPMCKVFTDTKFAVGLAVGNVVASVFSVGGVDEAELAARGFVETVVSKVVGDKVANVAARTGAQLFSKGAIKNAVGIAGATILAKLVVLSKSNQINSGFAQGADLANQAAAGGNLQGNLLEQQQLFGRPLKNSEVATSDSQDSQFVADQNQAKTFTNRYFALSNANSLVNHMAMSVSASFHGGFIASVVRVASSILHPLSYIGSLIGLVNHKVMAAPDPSTQHYGNVQFGWSQAEEALIDSSSSYRPLENQAILDGAIDTDGTPIEYKIAKTYAPCFGYTADDKGNLTSAIANNGLGSMGSLLSTGKIVRDINGDVLDEGLCSPTDLSFNSTSALALEPSGSGSPKSKDLIFRWRLAMSYGTTMDQLTGLQNVTN